jgi:A118 family predicted phage portal protein
MIDNTLGISIFANALDVLKGIDDIFDGFCNEFVLGRMTTYVSAQAYKIVRDEKNGRMVKTFDPYDSLYFQLPETTGTKEKPFIQTESPTLRYDAYIAGINTLLNILSKKCGFGNERYKFDKGSVATATQIISENSDLARSLRKQERLLKNALINLVLAIKDINNKYTLNEQFTDFKLKDIIINFDDSVIEDKNAIQERDRQDVQAGLMSEVEYRMKHYGKSEEEAKEDLIKFFLYKEIEKYVNALQQGVITPKEFVIRVYGEENNDLIAYITEQLESSKQVNPLTLFDETNQDDEIDNPEDNPEDNGTE